ncbi:MAG: hypothetical protein HYV32_05705 [Candidatus Kerfeldbacteria bacterium]|nr:hypothetical protein [Candidatus Kerfeldbacteria bacterium]
MVYIDPEQETLSTSASPKYAPAKKRGKQEAVKRPKGQNRFAMIRWFVYGSVAAIVTFAVVLYFTWMKLTSLL